MKKLNSSVIRLFLLSVAAAALTLLLPSAALADGPSVEFSLPGGTYDEPVELTLTCEEGWTICYRTDGSEPIKKDETDILSPTAVLSPDGLGNANPVHITVADSCTVKAVAYQKTGTWVELGPVISQTYQITSSGSVIVGDIKYSLCGGTYYGPVGITLSCAPG